MRNKFINELEDIASALERAAREAGVQAEVSRLRRGVTPDEPIHSSKEDRLNRTGFATELARAIIGFDRSESVVVGIHGRWGTGKSSLLNLLEEKLQVVSAEPPVIFRFNPWGFSDQEQLMHQFFAELAAFLRLHMSIPPLAGVSETVEEYGELLNPAAKLFFPRAAEVVSIGWKWFRKFRPPSKKTLPELKAHINTGLRQSARKLIIMIDDVDRLNATEVRQTFQLIKLNANFSNTVYVVAFDKGAVEKSLKEVAPGPPREYLEKIVQVPFSLPPIHEATLTEIIITNFNEALADLQVEKLDSQRFGNMFDSGFRNGFHTIRDVNRYFNLLRFALNLMRRDTDFIDLAAVEAIAVFYPVIYRSIETNPELFRGGWGTLEQREDNGSLRPKYDKIFSRLSEPRRSAALSLCQFLFPKLERVYGSLNVIYGPEAEQSWRKGKRIASAHYFPYYFQLAVPDTDISQSELDTTLARATSVDTFVDELRRFKASNRFAPLIDRLRDHVSSLQREQLLIILESIFVFGDEVSTEGAAAFGLISDYIRFGMWLLFDIVDLLRDKRFEILAQMMRGKTAVFTISDITAMCERIASGENDSARLKAKYPDLTEAIVSEMKTYAVDAIERAARENRLQSAPLLAGVLYRWKKWGDEKGVMDWVSSTFLKTPRGAISFLVSFATTVSSMGMRDRVPRTSLAISIKDLNEFADLNLLADLVRQLPDDQLTDKEKDAKAKFLSGKARLDSGKEPDLFYDPTA